jgi:hypothetical protein
LRQTQREYLYNQLRRVRQMATVKLKAPDGYHWMLTEGETPKLMEGEAHEGASEVAEFELVEPVAKPKEWDKIYRAILERTGNKDLAAATATARVGKAKDEPEPLHESPGNAVLFVISTPTPLDKARGAHLCGTTGVTFAKSYLEPIGLTRDDVDVISLDELKAAATKSPSVVVALGKAAKQVLGSAADCHLPHPQAIRKDAHRENLGRRLQELDALIIKAEDSYKPPKGVQEAAARGLKFRQEHGRGGTEVGVARARDLSNGRRVSRDTIMRMASYFERHAVDLKAPKNKDPGAPGYPGAGLVAHLLWGGDPGVSWSARIKAQIQREEASKSKQPVAISKADDAKRVVYGVVLDPYLVGDAHNDWVSAQEIEEAAHGWMAGSRVIGLEHNGEDKGATVVESWLHPYPTTEDYQAAIKGEPHQAYRSKFGDDVVHSGSWILGVKLSPERWADVQEGKLNAFSIGGTGTREPMSEAERPVVDFIDQG